MFFLNYNCFQEDIKSWSAISGRGAVQRPGHLTHCPAGLSARLGRPAQVFVWQPANRFQVDDQKGLLAAKDGLGLP